jgi:hypothetical protein
LNALHVSVLVEEVAGVLRDDIGLGRRLSRLMHMLMHVLRILLHLVLLLLLLPPLVLPLFDQPWNKFFPIEQILLVNLWIDRAIQSNLELET